MTTYNADQQLKRDTAANWTSNNPTLRAGEIGFETDTGKVKIGDGATAWTSLAYFNASKVPNTPSGNLAATTVQAALNELQTDVDTRLDDTAVWGDLADVDMTTAAPTTGQFANFDGTDWVPTDIDGGSA